MPWQLIYTSSPAGLTPGRSGFCTVARHRDIPERLVTALEQLSIYEPPVALGRIPILSHRSLSLGGDTYGILSFYCDAGLDYTSRRNYLAHHLVFTAAEMAGLPPPAEIAERFPGWRKTWAEPPRYLDDNDATLPPELLRAQTRLPAEHWKNITGDAGNAALLCPDGTPAELLVCDTGAGGTPFPALQLFAESSLLLRHGAWSATFTTCLQTTDAPAQFHWIYAHGNDPDTGVTSRPALTPQKISTPPPDTPAVRHARTGVPPEKQPRAAASPLLSKEKSPRRAAPENEPRAVSSRTEQPSAGANTWLVAGITTVAGALLCLALWHFVFRPQRAQSPRTQPAAPVAPRPSAEQPRHLSDLYANDTLRRDLDAALSAADWPRAAALWQQLQKDDPDTAQKRRADYQPLIQARLPHALADALERQFSQLAPAFKTEARAALRTALGTARQQLSDIGGTTPPASQNRLVRLEKQLAVLDALPAAPPPLTFSTWENSAAASRSSREIFSTLNSRKLHDFLGKKHAPLTLHLAPVSSWNDSDAAGTVTLPLPADALEPGKGLYISPATGAAPRLRFLLERRAGPVRLERTIPEKAAPLEQLLDSGKSLRLSLANDTDGTAAELLLLNPNTPPAPLRTSLDVLSVDGDTLAIPAWLRSALLRFELPNGLLILYPSGGTDYAREYSGPSLDRPTVERALRRGISEATRQTGTLDQSIAKLQEQRQTANDTTVIDADLRVLRERRAAYQTRKQALENRLAGVADKTIPLLRQGAPWTAGLVDHRSGLVLPLVVFE